VFSSSKIQNSYPLQLPESNIVYGESSKLTTYPVGTVMFYPPSVVPVRSSCTPWFIAYKPCPASLLGGAVPIGRVVSCKNGDEGPMGTDSDEDFNPFDEKVLKCFEACCEAKKCSPNFNTTITFS